jgi:hypothetical protein
MPHLIIPPGDTFFCATGSSPPSTDQLIVWRYILNDRRLSFKARRLFAYLLTNPDATLNDLTNSGPDERVSVLSGLKELEQLGYVTRSTVRDSSGRFVVVGVRS